METRGISNYRFPEEPQGEDEYIFQRERFGNYSVSSDSMDDNTVFDVYFEEPTGLRIYHPAMNIRSGRACWIVLPKKGEDF